MKLRLAILALFGAAIVALVILPRFRGNMVKGSPPLQSEESATRSQQNGTTNAVGVEKLHSLLVGDYHSTNHQAAIKSAAAHELIAEQLRTNEAFLTWATNAAISAIVQFVSDGNVPVYGAAGLTADSLHFYKVTAFAPVGLEAEATYDPTPATEGSLVFVVDGGVHPTVSLVKNPYRIESYQLDPDSWNRYGRSGQMDWSCAVSPLDKNWVDEEARNAFHEMTGLDLNSFNVETNIRMEKFLNKNAVHSGVTVTGSLQARLFTPKDYVYPFATFEYGNSNLTRVTFEGEMVQTSPGRGEFVSLLAFLNKTQGIFELGEKFLGQGTWEQDMVDQIDAMSEEQREQVFRRTFIR